MFKATVILLLLINAFLTVYMNDLSTRKIRYSMEYTAKQTLFYVEDYCNK